MGVHTYYRNHFITSVYATQARFYLYTHCFFVHTAKISNVAHIVLQVLTANYDGQMPASIFIVTLPRDLQKFFLDPVEKAQKRRKCGENRLSTPDFDFHSHVTD